MNRCVDGPVSRCSPRSALRCRSARLSPADVQHAHIEIDLIPTQVHKLGRSEAVPERQQDHYRVPMACRRLDQPLNLSTLVKRQFLKRQFHCHIRNRTPRGTMSAKKRWRKPPPTKPRPEDRFWLSDVWLRSRRATPPAPPADAGCRPRNPALLNLSPEKFEFWRLPQRDRHDVVVQKIGNSHRLAVRDLRLQINTQSSRLLIVSPAGSAAIQNSPREFFFTVKLYRPRSAILALRSVTPCWRESGPTSNFHSSPESRALLSFFLGSVAPSPSRA
jgi:hypothetical protein